MRTSIVIHDTILIGLLDSASETAAGGLNKPLPMSHHGQVLTRNRTNVPTRSNDKVCLVDRSPQPQSM